MKIAIDSLVRGRIGTTDKVDEMRVYHVGATTATGINADRRPRQMYLDQLEVIDGPRPVHARSDIPKGYR